MATKNSGMKIIVQEDGPYEVYGDIPLVRKTQVVSEYGEPLTWQREETIETSAEYQLCRCGQSSDLPFCDSTHRDGFDGTETGDTGPTAARQEVYPGGTKIVVKSDGALCSGSGFCGNRLAHIRELVARTDDTQVRGQVMAMIERCPSGSLTYALAEGGPGGGARPAPADRGDDRDHVERPHQRPALGHRQHPDRAGGWEAVRGAQPGHAVLLRRVEDQTAVRRDAPGRAVGCRLRPCPQPEPVQVDEVSPRFVVTASVVTQRRQRLKSLLRTLAVKEVLLQADQQVICWRAHPAPQAGATWQ